MAFFLSEPKSRPQGEGFAPAAPALHANLVFALIIAAAFLDIIDFSIIQIALPTIRTEFAISLADAQWIVGSYGLTLAGFLLLSGRAGDIYGQKKLFIIGVSIFSLASLTGGLAPSFLFLVASRAVQGVAAAISTVTALAIFAQIFPEGKSRNRALGFFVAVLSAGFAAGSLAGGVLTAGFGWRSVMFVNVPIGVVTAILSVKYLPLTGGFAQVKHLDLWGGLSSTAGILLFVYSLTNAATYGFGSVSTLIPLAISVLLLASFLVIESRSEAPLMPLAFLRRGVFLAANIIALIVAAASGGLGFIITIYMQQVLGYSALSTGLAFLPSAVVFLVVGGWGSSWFVSHLGVKRVLLLSLSLIIVGNLLLTQIPVDGSFLAVEPGSILWALGASIGFPALFIAALTGLKPGEEGLASGLISTSQRIGFPMGLAILVTVASLVTSQPMSAGASLADVVMGFRYAFVAATVLSIVGLALVFMIKDSRPQNADPTPT
jgi:MFS family permease